MIRTLRNRLLSLSAPVDEVHFHQGPQGQPVPCFDDRCQSPRLSA